MIGFENIGNSCYVNALLQCMIHLENIQQIFDENAKTNNKISEHFSTIIQIKQKESEVTCNVSSLVNAICKESNGLFQLREQHDICELYVWLIDQLHEGTKFSFEVKEGIVGPVKQVWEMLHKMQKGTHSQILELLQGVQVNLLKCKNCEDQPYNLEPFSCIYLNIPTTSNETSNLCDLLADHFKSEEMSEWKCEKCNQYGGTRKIRLWSLPSILVVVLKRFGNDMKKVNTLVHVPEFIQFAKGTVWKQPTEAYSYRLRSIGNHFGSYNGGHYTAVARDGENKWIHWDDNGYEELKDIKSFLDKNKNAYIMFYERVIDADSKS